MVSIKKSKTSEKMDRSRLGTEEEGECGHKNLTRKVTFEERLEGNEEVSLDHVGVMNLPEKGCIENKALELAHAWCVEGQGGGQCGQSKVCVAEVVGYGRSGR